MRIVNAFRKMAMVATIGMSMSACAAYEIYPSLDTPLNDFDPTVAVGEYIQKISSNTVNEVVSLSNGVLTVGSESINVAEPTHEVVVTNIVEGEEVITTNTYGVVYQDGLDTTLKEYAKLKKITSIITNTVDGTVTTNWTDVAYLDDIPPDTEKADKVMRVWDYQMDGYDGVLLTRSLDKDAPFASWEFDGDTNGIQNVKLFFTNGIWNASINGGEYATVSGDVNAASISFAALSRSFTMTNDTRYAFVVYTDMLDSEMKQKLSEYVPTTNLFGISAQIVENKLHTMGGIQEILRGIRDEINSMASGSGIHLTFNNVGGSTLVLGAADMRIPGDTVNIDWGDGTSSVTNLPASHTYADSVGNVKVVITGFMREISGTSTRAEEGTFPFASFMDNNNGRLVGVRIDPIVGLESLGYAAFYGCTGLDDDLTFIPDTVTTLGDKCFEGSGITSLAGMPDGITDIPSRCFFGCNGLRSLTGLSPGILSIGDEAFEQCNQIISLIGIPQGVATLGASAFSDCAVLASLAGLAQTQVLNIPDYCFANTIVSSLQDVPSAVTNIGERAFSGTNISSIDNAFTNLLSIGEYAFSGCSQLQSADLSQSPLATIGSSAFRNSYNLTSFTIPASVTSIGGLALEAGTGIKVNIDKTFSQTTNMMNFAWGVDATSRFICSDGELYYENGEWKVLSERTTFTLANVPSGNHTIALGDIGTSQSTRMTARSSKRSALPPTVKVDWGDGPADSSSSHVYTLSTETNIIFTVIGKLQSIAGADGKPFVTIDNLATNEYLASVDFGNGVAVKSLGNSAFKNCTGLEVSDITGLGSSLDTLGNDCFEGTKGESLAFLEGTSVKAYPSGCFRNASLTSLAGMSQNLETLGDGCFEGCTGLTDDSIVRIGDTKVVAIPDGCFKGCLGLTSVTNGLDKITSIGNDAFANCTRISDISINNITNVGRRAFDQVGNDTSVPIRRTEDNIPYKVMVDVTGRNFNEAAAILGLENSLSGLPPTETIVNCADDATLVWNNTTAQRWEVLMDALDISLENVPNGKQFMVQGGGVNNVPGAMVIWNWGDGTNSGWVNGVPPVHTYSNAGTSNYLVKVRGLVASISSAETVGPFLRPTGTAENPYLTGFKLPETSTLRTIGDYSFSRCPNMRAVNRIDAPRSAGGNGSKKKSVSLSRNAGRSLASLHDYIVANRGNIEFGAYCFSYSGISDLSSFPSDVDRLSIGLFKSCPNITSLTGLDSGIVDMGGSCFAENTSLATLDGFPQSLTYIATNGFQDCIALTTLAALSSSSVSSIGDYAFAGCMGLSSLYGLPNSLQWVGEGAFTGAGLSSLDGLPQGVNTISPYAFSYCPSLVTIGTYPSSLSKIDEGMFLGCKSLTTIGTVPTNVTSIGQYSFAMCGNIADGSISGTLTNIEDNVLLNIGNSREPTVVDGITASTRILALEHLCTNLVAILSAHSNNNPLVMFECKDGYVVNTGGAWIPKLKTIEFELENVLARTTFALGGVEALPGEAVTVNWGDGSEEETYAPGMSHQYAVSGSYRVMLIGFISRLAGSGINMPVLRRITGGNPYLTSVFVGDATKTTELGDDCFSNCTALRSIGGLSASPVRRFGNRCFRGCISLENLVGMPQEFEEMGEGCFSRCTSLASLEGLPGSVFELPDGCFEFCTGITTISNLPVSITTIGDNCFNGCTGLGNLEGLGADGTVRSFGAYVFANCTMLTNLVGYGTNNTALGMGMFKGCTGLASLEGLSREISTIPDECFFECTNILNLETLPFLVSSIGDSAFRECRGLTNLIGTTTNLVAIGNFAFAECSLESLEGLKENARLFGAYAFADNFNLSNVTALVSNTNDIIIADGMFSGCSALGSVEGLDILPARTISIGTNAFYGCALKNPLEVPTTCQLIGTNAFARTSVPDVTIYTNSLSRIYADAFAEETNMTYSITNGITVTRRIRFPQISSDYVMSLDDFPWGVSDTTIFICSNGYLTKHNDEWTLVFPTAIHDIDIGSTSAQNPCVVAANGIVGADAHGIIVEWGDGNVSKWIANGQQATNRYSSSGHYQITIHRPFYSFGFTEGEGIIALDKIGGSGYLYKRTLEVFAQSECNAIGIKSCDTMRTSVFPSLPASVTNLCRDCFSSARFTEITNLPPNTSVIGEGAFRDCSWLTNFEMRLPNLVSLPANCLANASSLRDLLLDIPQARTISTNALTNIGSSLSSTPDEDGYSIKSTVRFASHTVSEFLNAFTVYLNRSDGMFDAPTSTKFSLLDGDIVWDGSKWIVNYGKFIITMDIPETTRFVVNGIAAADGEKLTWDWGDGWIVTNITNQADIPEHELPAGIRHIRVSGKVGTLFGVDNAPFLSKANDNTNPYLTAITISDVSEDFIIGKMAFSNCMGLETIADIKAPYAAIGESAFSNCLNITSVTVPANCTTISNYAFSGCASITNVTLKNLGITYMGESVFHDCFGLRTLHIKSQNWPETAPHALETPNSILVYAEDVLGDTICTNLNTVANVLEHSSVARGFDGDVTYDSATSNWVFRSSAIKFFIDSGVKFAQFVDVPECYNHNSRFKIDWGDGTRYTYDVADLWWNSYGQTWYYPDSASPILLHHFVTTGPHTITLAGDILRISGKWYPLYGGGERPYCYKPFLVTSRRNQDSRNEFASDAIKGFEVGEVSRLQYIGEGAFAWCLGLRANNINIRSPHIDIEKSAFVQSGIDNMSFWPSTVNYMPDYCFMGCKNITGLASIPFTVTSLGAYCFGLDDAWITLDKPQINSLVGMPDSIVSLGTGCFRNLNISSLNGISSGVRSLGVRCFENCPITSLVGLPEGIRDIPDYCFHNTRLNTFVGMPQSVERLGVESLSPYYGTDLQGVSTNITYISPFPVYGHQDLHTIYYDSTSPWLDTPNLTSIKGFPPKVDRIPYKSFRGYKGKTAYLDPQIISSAYQCFSSGTRLVFSRYSEDDIWHEALMDDRMYWQPPLSVPYTKLVPWFPPHIEENSHETKTVFVNKAIFQYTIVQPFGVGWDEYWTITKSLPYIKAKMTIPAPNVEINLGDITFFDNETPIFVDWGDGTVECKINEYNRSHIYSESGDYLIMITTMATEISGYNDGPFVSVGSTGQNPYLTEFHFSDSIGITNIGATCFANCTNLTLIQCDATVMVGDRFECRYPYVRSGTELIKSPYLYPRITGLLDSSHTSDELRTLPNYPWGYTGNEDRIIGIETQDISDGNYIKLELKGITAGQRIYLGSYETRTNENLRISWGDGGYIVVPASETKDNLYHYTYSSDGDYTIIMKGAAAESGASISGIHVASTGSNPSGDFAVIYDIWTPPSWNNKYSPQARSLPNLSSVQFGHGLNLTNIGYRAFWDCTSLTKVDMSMLTNLVSIGDEAFLGTYIDGANLPMTVRHIGKNALASNSGTQRFTLPMPIQDISIEDNAFGTVNVFSRNLEIAVNSNPQDLVNLENFPFFRCDFWYGPLVYTESQAWYQRGLDMLTNIVFRTNQDSQSVIPVYYGYGSTPGTGNEWTKKYYWDWGPWPHDGGPRGPALQE